MWRPPVAGSLGVNLATSASDLGHKSIPIGVLVQPLRTIAPRRCRRLDQEMRPVIIFRVLREETAGDKLVDESP
jgi:hypothetical protein